MTVRDSYGMHRDSLLKFYVSIGDGSTPNLAFSASHSSTATVRFYTYLVAFSRIPSQRCTILQSAGINALADEKQLFASQSSWSWASHCSCVCEQCQVLHADSHGCCLSNLQDRDMIVADGLYGTHIYPDDDQHIMV